MRLLAVLILLIPMISCVQNRSTPPAVAVLRSGPRIGDRAPDFTLPWASKDGVGPVEAPYQLWRDLGKTIVLAFYPQAFTQSSATEFRAFADQYGQLFGPDVVVVGISTDSLERQSRFAAELELPFRLLSDTAQRVVKQYAGADARGLSRRVVYVIGPDGDVAYRDSSFDPSDANAYAKLGAAVKAARQAKPE